MNPRWRVAALGAAMVFPTVLAWTYFVALAVRSEGEAKPNAAIQAVYFCGKALQFAFPLLWIWGFERSRVEAWSALPGKRNFAAGLRYGGAFGLAVAAGTLLLYFAVLRRSPFLAATPAQLRVKVAEFGLGTPAGFLLLAFFLAAVHSLLEEYYWRWFVFGGLERLMPVGPAVALSSLAFMAHHVIVLAVFFPGQFLTATVPFSLGVAAGGAAWAWVYHRTGSLAAVWLSHFLVDAALMAVGFDLIFVPSPAG